MCSIVLRKEPEKSLSWPRKRPRRFNHDYIGTEHLLLGLIREGEGVAAAVLQKLGLSLESDPSGG